MLIDYIKITPFNELGDVPPHETYPDIGYADFSEYPEYFTNSTLNSVALLRTGSKMR